MKANTLWQPWASLVAVKRKDIETRHWAPRANLIGQRIAIHAAARKPVVDLDLCVLDAMEDEFGGHWFMDIPRGAVVCTAILDGAYQVATGRRGEDGMLVDVGNKVLGSPDICALRVDDFGDFRQGRWLWHLICIETVAPPIQVRGAQGFWNWSVSDAGEP